MTLIPPSVALGLAALVLLGCGAEPPESSNGDTAEEITDFAEPTDEAPDQTDPADNGATQAAVELPGLPVGGNEVVFQEPSTQCASVNTTNFDLPEGVRIVVTRFDVPPEFTVSPDPCGSAPACLGGHEFVAGGSSCEVAVSWQGVPPVDAGALAAGAATAFCDDAALCSQVLADVQGAAGGAIQLVVFPPEEEGSTDTETDPGDAVTQPTDEATE